MSEFEILTEHIEIITQYVEKFSSLPPSLFHIFLSHFTFCNTLRFAAPSYVLRTHFTFCSTLRFATLHCATLLYVLQHFTFCGPTLFHPASLMPPGCGVVGSAMLFLVFNGVTITIILYDCVDGGYRLRVDVLS